MSRKILMTSPKKVIDFSFYVDYPVLWRVEGLGIIRSHGQVQFRKTWLSKDALTGKPIPRPSFSFS